MTTRQTQAIMRKSLITIGLAAASLAAIAGLTGCGTASHSAPVAATATGMTANDRREPDLEPVAFTRGTTLSVPPCR